MNDLLTKNLNETITTGSLALTKPTIPGLDELNEFGDVTIYYRKYR